MQSLPLAEQDGGVTVAVTGEHPALVREPIRRLIRRVALPAVASNLLMTAFLAADAFWVGRRLGATSLAAVTASVFWVWMGISVAEMVSVGLTAVAARRHGERRPQEAARAAGDALLLAVALGVAAAIAGRLGLDAMFRLMRTPPEVAAIGRAYLALYVLAAPVLYGYFAVDATFRASGDTRTPFVILLGTVALALLLDPVLILGLGPAPRLGIAGAAIATVSSRGLAFVVGLVLLRRRGMLRFGRPRLAVLAAVSRIGLPTAATGVLFSVVYVVVARIAARFGTPALAALGLGFRVESWLYMLGVGFGAAAAAVVGQNLGAGRVDRATRAGWAMLGVASVPAVGVALATFLVPEALASVFTRDASLVAETARYLRIASVAQLVVCGEVVLEGALGGAGATVAPMLASVSLTLSRIPLSVWAGTRFGIEGLWWVISATAAARGVAMMALWRWGRWKRNLV
jgi:putative MATE family efflux protein